MTNEITEALRDFSPEKFISTVETAVNNFSFRYEETAQAMMEMDDEKQGLLQDAIKSCIYALAHTDRTDGRNEIASEACRQLNPEGNPIPEAGKCFVRIHPTLQQSAMKLFCCYLEKAEIAEYQAGIDELKSERGSKWYCFPLI